VLGFDKYWKYDKQTDLPYMWAEANNYYYRGTLIAKLKGGNVYTAPEIIIPNGEDGEPIMPEPQGISLRPVDVEAMVEANREMLEIIEQTTVKKILAVYTKYKDRLDCFHVAFSGGKDSCVLLDLVKKALPKGSFMVVFGDTGMEFPDTYDVIGKTKKQCLEDEIPFYIAKSHFDPKVSWELFGPPSRTLRWCCSVHKSTPQTLKLREVTGKHDYTGLAFVGVRAQESATRAEYEYLNDGKKIKGQFNHNSILEWTSAEVWLYIYGNSVVLNEAYKKGSARVGCICCPMGGGKDDYIKYNNFANISNQYFSLIHLCSTHNGLSTVDFITTQSWCSRKNGILLLNNDEAYVELLNNEILEIRVSEPKTDWKEWIKTLGDLSGNGGEYIITFDEQQHSFSIQASKQGYVVSLSDGNANPRFGKLFRYTFRKAAYCLGCKTCQAICKFGCISFEGGMQIDNCQHCLKCHSMTDGCLAYNSRKIPKNEGVKMRTLDCFNSHSPKLQWIDDFFIKQNDFFANNSLAAPQRTKFKRFLRDAGLINHNGITDFCQIGIALNWNSAVFLGLMLLNLVYRNPEFEWFCKAMIIGKAYCRKEIVDALTVESQSKGGISNIIADFKRLTETPLGTSLHWGLVTEDGDLVRTKCTISDLRVVLYGLFKFAEKCNDYKEFTLATLLNDSIERDGVSPTRIFGLDREETTPMLLGLSAKYPEFITASFTHDLEKITLAEDKSSQDVLDLFKEGNGNA
jgi:phosphoadenosine phosphosulfate reductase